MQEFGDCWESVNPGAGKENNLVLDQRFVLLTLKIPL
jgi:hypothetical protein